MIDYNVLINRMIDSHQIVELLGFGGMGAVFKAYDHEFKRWEALKIINPQLLTQPELIRQFRVEAEAATGLNHHNIAQLYYVGNFQGVPYYTMEFIQGKSFAEVLRERGKISGSSCVNYLIQICDGLEYCQYNGVIHRDLKPANLMLTHEGMIKVVDFGLAVILQEGSRSSEADQILGTPKYIAPESGTTKILDHRSDIYSLGATFYHLIAGEPAFDAESPYALLHKHISESLLPLHERNPIVPEVLSNIISKMMAKNPKERYQTYKELKDDLMTAKQTGFRKVPGRVIGIEPLKKEKPKNEKMKKLMPVFLVVGTVLLLLLAVLISRTESEKEKPKSDSDFIDYNRKPGPGVSDQPPAYSPVPPGSSWGEGIRAIEQAKMHSVRTRMRNLAIMVEQYISEHGSPPESLGDMLKDFSAPQQTLRDNWGNDIILEVEEGGGFSLISAGPDRIFDTADDIYYPER